MKVIDVSEVMNAIDSSITKKKNEKEQVLQIRDSLNGIIHLEEALEGAMGNSVKDHFVSFHIPVILLLNQFLSDYQKKLKEVKSFVLDYETEGAIVRQLFVEHDMEQGLDRVKNVTNQSIGNINEQVFTISDLVSVTPLSSDALMHRYDSAHAHNRTTIQDLLAMDKDGAATLKEAAEDLKQIVQLIQKLKQWTVPANLLKKETINEIDSYFAENEKLSKLMDEAIETSIKDGNATPLGNAAEVLGTMSKWTGIKSALQGALTATVLLSKRLVFVKDGKGNFKIQAHPDWKKKNGKYNSKLASVLYDVIKKGSNSSVTFIKKEFNKLGNAPSSLLKNIIGMNPRSTRRSYGSLLNERFRFIRFAESGVKSYAQFPVDVKKTAEQFTTKEGAKQVIKRIPYAGVAMSFITNSSEMYSDKNKYKSRFENGGRAAAGMGLDLGVAGLTAGGAAIGSMIFPGPGTIIGGAVGAAIGIGGSMYFEEKAKAAGEKAGKWVEEKLEVIEEKNDYLVESLSKGKKLVANLFR